MHSVRLIAGDADAPGGDPAAGPELRAHFSDLEDSLFTLGAVCATCGACIFYNTHTYACMYVLPIACAMITCTSTYYVVIVHRGLYIIFLDLP